KCKGRPKSGLHDGQSRPPENPNPPYTSCGCIVPPATRPPEIPHWRTGCKGLACIEQFLCQSEIRIRRAKARENLAFARHFRRSPSLKQERTRVSHPDFRRDPSRP